MESFIVQEEEEEEEEDWRLSELALFFFAQFGDGLFKEKEAQSIEGILVTQTKCSRFHGPLWATWWAVDFTQGSMKWNKLGGKYQ